jgi:glycine dehydrogenase subunit 2
VVLSEALCPFGPLPFTELHADGHLTLVEEELRASGIRSRSGG